MLNLVLAKFMRIKVCNLLLAGIINKNVFSRETRFEEAHAQLRYMAPPNMSVQ